MDYQLKYLKYKSKYLNLRKKISFKNMIGGCKPYIEALAEIFDKFKGDDSEHSLKKDTELLQEILEKNEVSPCHGIVHAKTVMYHAWCALEHAIKEYELSEEDQLAVLLAALLHDADDRKFFPTHKNYENLREILSKTGKSADFIEDVVFMVSIVSASKNGDKIPRCVRQKEWMLIPRYADRIEAIGIIGIERCHTYSRYRTSDSEHRMPLFISSTPKPTTEEGIWEEATEERYKRYDGNSASMIDHYYDKLLRLSVFPIRNKYFDEECAKRRQPLIDFLIYFGQKGIITDEEVLEFIRKNSAPVSITDE
jgi:uncharacterized protein